MKTGAKRERMPLAKLERELTEHPSREPRNGCFAYRTSHALASQQKRVEPDDAVLAVSRILAPFLRPGEERTFDVDHIPYSCLAYCSSLLSSQVAIDTIALCSRLCYFLLHRGYEVSQFDWFLKANEMALFDLMCIAIQACTQNDCRDVL